MLEFVAKNLISIKKEISFINEKFIFCGWIAKKRINFAD